MALPNGNEPPEGPPARTIAARIVGKLSTLAGVSLTTRAQVSAIDVIANEVRPLMDGVTQREAELVRAGVMHSAAIERMQNRLDAKQAECDELRAGLDDTDVIEPPEPGKQSLAIDDGLLDIATRCGGPG